MVHPLVGSTWSPPLPTPGMKKFKVFKIFKNVFFVPPAVSATNFGGPDDPRPSGRPWAGPSAADARRRRFGGWPYEHLRLAGVLGMDVKRRFSAPLGHLCRALARQRCAGGAVAGSNTK